MDDSALAPLRAALAADPRAPEVLATLPGGQGVLGALRRSPPDFAAIKAFLKDQVSDGISDGPVFAAGDQAALDTLAKVVTCFAAEVRRVHAALDAEAQALMAENFQQTFGAKSPDADQLRGYFKTVQRAVAADAQLRVALRRLPEGAALLAALAAGDVRALQAAINQRLDTRPLAVDGQYGAQTHDALLSYLGVARLVLEHAPDGPQALKAELERDFDALLALGGARRIPTDPQLQRHFQSILVELDRAPDFKTFLAGLPGGKTVLDALAKPDPLALNRLFRTGDANNPSRSGYDFQTHSALGLFLDNAKHRAAQAALQTRADAQAAADLDAARRRGFQQALGVAPGQVAGPVATAAYLKSLGERLRASVELQLKIDTRFVDAVTLGQALKAGSVDRLQAFLKENGYAVPAASAGKMDFATYCVVEQLVDDVSASVAPEPPPAPVVGEDEGQLNATLIGDSFFVSYNLQIDQKRTLALKAGVGKYGIDSAEVWFNQQEENKRYTAALRADFLERAFAGKFESEGHRDIGRGFSHEWEYQVGFAVLAGMYSRALERQGEPSGQNPDGTPRFDKIVQTPGYTYDTALLVAGGRYGIGFDRTWKISDTPDKKLTIGFNWHADIGAHLSYELYHPPGNDLALAAAQSNITFTDISYLLAMSELRARATANFTVDGLVGGVHLQGLVHLDSRIGMDDPTLGFTHNHNIAAALDLGFLNDTITLHLGVNVPIYPSTLATLLANPLGTIGLQLHPTPSLTLGASASFNLTDGSLQAVGAEITYAPSRLFGLDTGGSVFIKGSYEYSRGEGGLPYGHTVMVSLGMTFDGSGPLPLPGSTVDRAYANPVTRPLLTPPERQPRPDDDTTDYKTTQNSSDLLTALRPKIELLRAQAKRALDAGNDAVVEAEAHEAMALLATPEVVSAACDDRGGGLFTFQFHVDEPSKFTPAAFFAKGYGVCAEFHIFAAATLRVHGRQSYPIEFFAPGLSHCICAFRDDGGLWQILEYAAIHHTNSKTPEQALRTFEPGVMKYKIFEPEGGRARVVEQGTSPLVSSLQSFFDRSWL
jgi:hypothetical protein